MNKLIYTSLFLLIAISVMGQDDRYYGIDEPSSATLGVKIEKNDNSYHLWDGKEWIEIPSGTIITATQETIVSKYDSIDEVEEAVLDRFPKLYWQDDPESELELKEIKYTNGEIHAIYKVIYYIKETRGLTIYTYKKTGIAKVVFSAYRGKIIVKEIIKGEYHPPKKESWSFEEEKQISEYTQKQ